MVEPSRAGKLGVQAFRINKSRLDRLATRRQSKFFCYLFSPQTYGEMNKSTETGAFTSFLARYCRSGCALFTFYDVLTILRIHAARTSTQILVSWHCGFGLRRRRMQRLLLVCALSEERLDDKLMLWSSSFGLSTVRVLVEARFLNFKATFMKHSIFMSPPFARKTARINASTIG